MVYESQLRDHGFKILNPNSVYWMECKKIKKHAQANTLKNK
jgi:hypothetical protein